MHSIKSLGGIIRQHKILTAVIVLALVALCFIIHFVANLLPFLFLKPVTVARLDELSLDGYDKVMIVAHPDDETFWGAEALINDDYLVVCITRGYDDTRREEFEKVVSSTGDKALILSYPDKIGGKRSKWSLWRGDIEDDIKTILAYKDWDTVVTHNERGEYGHQHHILTHNLVTDAYNRLSLSCKFYNFGKYYSPGEQIPNDIPQISDDDYNRKLEMVDSYASQSYARKKFEHMFRYENWQLISGTE